MRGTIFEKKIFDKEFDTKLVREWAEDVYEEDAGLSWVENVFSWFKSRYEIDDGHLASEWIYALGFYKKKTRVKHQDAFRLEKDHMNHEGVRVSEILNKATPSISEQIEGMAYIVHRVRNNFFHGEKDLYSMSSQIPLLKKCNEFLSGCIDDLSSKQCTLVEIQDRPARTPSRDLQDQQVYPRIAKRSRD